MEDHIYQQHDEKRLVEQVLRHLLPEGAMPIASPDKRAIALFWGSDASQNSIVLFTPGEWKVLLALAESYPHYSPYEVILSQLTSTPPEHCRQLLHDAEQKRTLRQELRPIRRTVWSLRSKLRPFALEVPSVLEAGYTLSSLSRPSVPQEHGH